MSAEPAGRVLIASNRGPVSFSLGDDGRLTSRRGGGGVVAGLSAVAGRAEVLWVCAALNDADRAAARAAPDGRLDVSLSADGAGRPGPESGAGLGGPESMVRMLDIPALVFDRAYNGVANSTLWFIHHLLYDTPNRPLFGLAFRREWESFRAYNAAFADALAEGAGPAIPGATARAGTRAMVQDYHLTLVPRMLAERRPDLAIAHFSHTPWAPPEYFALLPDDVAREVLEGILGADHAGFHAQRWADAFLDCCEAVLGAEVDRAARTVRHAGHTTTVGVHPLGVDAPQLRTRAAADDVQAHVAALTELAGDRKLIVRIDRTELSKNIVRGLAAYRELLDHLAAVARTGRPPGLRLPVPPRPARVPRVHGQRAADGAGDRGRVRHRGLGSAGAAGQRRLPALARRVPAGRRAARQPGQGRHEPGRQGGARCCPNAAAPSSCPGRPARRRNWPRALCW